ncbi:hypothetical protein ACROYT_G002435 [Oculina patagonica]
MYLGNGAVGITLEMKITEWDEERFKQAIVKGLLDFCMGNACRLRNKTIAKEFCHSFLNSSAFNVTQVMIVGQPTESFPNHTKVNFAVIIRPESSSQPKIVLNTTLEYVVQESANSISKYLGGYKTVYVNNLRPSSDCYENNDINEEVRRGNNREKEEKTKGKSIALIIGISGVIAVLAVVVVIVVSVWYRRRGGIEGNQQRDIEEVRPNVMYAYENNFFQGNEEMRGPGAANLNISRNEENFNNRNHGQMENRDVVSIHQREHCEGYESRNIVVNQPRGNSDEQGCEVSAQELDSHQSAGDYEEINVPQASSRPQETFNGAVERRNVAGNQQRDNINEQDCEGYENLLAQEMDNQQSEGVYEDIDAPQAPFSPQETSSGVLPAPSLSATPHDADQGNASNDNYMSLLSDNREIGRRAVEHDESDNGSGTYVDPVQCTDDLEKNPHT